MNSNSANSNVCKRGQQRGAVMIVALIMLVIITLLAVSAVQTSNLEVLMATNTQARASALVDAENALVDGELYITTTYPSTPLFDWSDDITGGALDAEHDGFYTIGEGVASTVDDIDWSMPADGDDPVGFQLSPDNCTLTSIKCNQYALEYLGPYTTAGASLTMGAGVAAGDKRYLYRVTGRGEFGSGGTRFVQSVFATME